MELSQAGVLVKKSRFDEAEKLLISVFEYLDSIGQVSALGIPIIIYAELMLAQNKIEDLEKKIEWVCSKGRYARDGWKGRYYSIKGEICLKSDNWKEAEVHFYKAVDTAREFSEKVMELESLLLWCSYLNRNKSDYLNSAREKAMKHLKDQYATYTDKAKEKNLLLRRAKDLLDSNGVACK